jgi:beta-lactam-binding protein with PASTA domain
MSRIIRIVMLTLILVLVALVSALTAMRIAMHALLDRGLRLEVESRFYSPEVPEGRIMSQFPNAETIVRRGGRVRIAESLGSPRAKVPDLTGQSSRAAEINMRRRGLEVGAVIVVHLPGLPADQVIATSPPAGSTGSSPKVNLLLTSSEQPQTLLMPNLIGRKLSETAEVIQHVGLQLSEVNQLSNGSESKAGSPTIVGQWPSAGSRVRAGSNVRLQITKN